MKKATLVNILFVLVLGSLASFFIVTSQILYPFFAPKTLFFRSLIILGLPFYVYLLVIDKSLRPKIKNPLTASLLFFLAISLIAGFFGVNSTRSFWGNYERMGGNFQLAHFILLYFYILLLTRFKDSYLSSTLKFVTWTGVLVSFYAVFEKLGMAPWVPDDSLPLRVSSIFGNPIFFASFLILPLALSLFFAFQNEGKWRYVYFFAAFMQLLGVILSGTRGAIVGLFLAALVALVYFLLTNQKNRKSAVIALAVLTILGFSFWLIALKVPEGSLLKRLVTFRDSNGQARLIQWGIALKGFKEQPVLGVGPENYYIIANKFFDRKLYTYDYSWFDKPHNYQLEILTTTGTFGFLAYAAIFIFSLYGVYKAQKHGVLLKAEATALIFGLIAYQAQNLFVFDTPSAALTFFIFTALCGIFLEGENIAASVNGKPVKNFWAKYAFWPVAIFAIYIFVVIDYATAKVLRQINFAYAVDIKDPVLTKASFDQVQTNSFIYDRGELATKMEEFTVRAVQDSNKKDDKEFINSLFDDTISQLQLTVNQTNNNPIYWYKLGNMYSQKAYFNKAGYDSRAEEAINKAISLVPNRIEPLFFIVQIKALQNDLPSVVKTSEQIVNMVPNNAEAVWRLALAYKDGGQKDKAAETAEKALGMGYQFKLVREFAWLINYYADKEDYSRVVDLYETAVKIKPSDYQLYASLATAYARNNQRDQAIAAAHKVLELNPNSKPTVEAFLAQLGAQ